MVLVYFNVDIFIELLKSMLFNPLYNIIYNYPLNTKQKEKKRMIKGTITCGLILASFALTGQSNKAYTLNKEGDTIRQLPRFEQLVGKPGESKTFHNLKKVCNYQLFDTYGKLIEEGRDQFVDMTNYSVGSYFFIYDGKKESYKKKCQPTATSSF